MLNWNAIDTTRLAIQDLLRATNVSLHVYVVDNGSSSDESNVLAAEFPAITVIALPKNLGFARGVNAGAVKALADGCSHILLFNNDARIEPDAVIGELLATVLRDEFIGAVGPLVKNADGSVQSSGYKYSMWWPIPRAQRGTQSYEHGTDTYYLSGSCLLISAAALRAAGGMDGDYFLYGDDVDFALRMRSRGYREALVPSVSIRHARASATTLYSARYAYTALRSNLIVISKHAKWFQMPSAWVACGCATLALAILGVARGQSDVPRAVVSAWIDFAQGRWYGYADAAAELELDPTTLKPLPVVGM